jgi:hypothetical protein
MSELTELAVAITSRGFLAGPPEAPVAAGDAEASEGQSEDDGEGALDADAPVALDLRIDTLRTWLEPLESLERVTFTGPGDPLLHPRVAYLVRVAREAGAYVVLETAATVLEGRLVHDLIEAGLDELRVRLDSWTRHGYQGLRHEDRYNDVVRKLVQFKDQKRMMLVEYPVVSLVLREPGQGPKGRGRRGQSMATRLGAARVLHLAPPAPQPEPLEEAPAASSSEEIASRDEAPVADGAVTVSEEAPTGDEAVSSAPDTGTVEQDLVDPELAEEPAPEADSAPEVTPEPAAEAVSKPAPEPEPAIPYVAVDGRVYPRSPATDDRQVDPSGALGNLKERGLLEILAT